MDYLIKVLASGFGLGYMPFAPGTFGTLAGVLFFLMLAQFSPAIYIISTVILFFLASYISSRAESIYNKKDAGVIVIDEITGFLVTMALIKPSLHAVVLGFLLFRFFDIVKVWPARYFDKLHGGFAVVLDDVIAGIYANILLRVSLAFF